MNGNEISRKSEPALRDLLHEQYQNAENRQDVDYWEPFAELIMEALKLRSRLGLSQSDVARTMNTKQSVVSRFENMGRKPSYDFIIRLANAFGQKASITLCGDFTATVSPAKQDAIRRIAGLKNLDPRELVAGLLEDAVDSEIRAHEKQSPRVASAGSSFHQH